jgi:NAD(P)-dependent dehydrogenase (short-subunit alcohol dehydrogenase family)
MSKVSLKEKIAVVTGSSKGIGFAISKEFAENNGTTVLSVQGVFKKRSEQPNKSKVKRLLQKLI